MGHVCNDVMLGGRGGEGNGYIEMLMSPHSGGDSWRGTEDGVMSPLISAKEKNDEGGVG